MTNFIEFAALPAAADVRDVATPSYKNLPVGGAVYALTEGYGDAVLNEWVTKGKGDGGIRRVGANGSHYVRVNASDLAFAIKKDWVKVTVTPDSGYVVMNDVELVDAYVPLLADFNAWQDASGADRSRLRKTYRRAQTRLGLV
jgi:oligoribonuclease (3'-5' exoribonuclease)